MKAKFKLKNSEKGGFLLAEETLKIILAVIAIGFLAYLLFSVYKSNKDSKNMEFAKSSLEFLVQKINSNQEEVEIFNPKKWFIYSWPNVYTKTNFLFLIKNSEEGIPKSCENLGWDTCICFCKKANPSECDSKGVCRENTKGLSINEPIEIDKPPISLLINHEVKKISRKN